MIRPAQGHISQGFSAEHRAVDIANSVAVPVLAPVAGTVTRVGQLGSGTLDAGLVVQIGDENNGHRLCHLERYHVKVGDTVSQGQHVGDMGFTGYTIPADARGRHLHWIMWLNGQRVNGLNYITATSTPPVQASTQTNGGNSLMTPEFIRRGYYIAYGDTYAVSQKEIDFHMAKSTPASFLNGFGDNVLWRVKQGEIDTLSGRIRQLEESNSASEAEINTLKAERTMLQSALDEIRQTTKAVYNFVAEPRVVIINAQADALNLRKSPDTKAEIATVVKDGASIATLGYITNGADVNGLTKWYKTLDGNYFTAAYATEQSDTPIDEVILENEIDEHIEKLESTDFRKTFDDRAAGKYRAKQEITVYDYSNTVEPVVCPKGYTVDSAGTFERLGITYHLTKKSTQNPDGTKKHNMDDWIWRGVPASAIDVIEYDNWLYAVSDKVDELPEEATQAAVNLRHKIVSAIGSSFAIITGIAAKFRRS